MPIELHLQGKRVCDVASAGNIRTLRSIMGDVVKRAVICPKCAKRLSAPESFAGRKLKCPQCATTFPCTFAAGPLAPAATTRAPSAFKTIEIAGPPKRSVGVELGRLAFGMCGSVIGAGIGALLFGGLSLAIGYFIGLLGTPIVGGLSGLGMRLGYGRSGDVPAGLLSCLPAALAFVFTWLELTRHHGTNPPIVSTLVAMSISFTAASGISLRDS